MSANSGDPDQTPHSVASALGFHSLPTSNKKDARVTVNLEFFARTLFSRNFEYFVIINPHEMAKITVVD